MRILTVFCATLMVIVGAYWFNASKDHSTHQTAQRLSDGVEISLPVLSSVAEAGETLFHENCSACHGQHAIGSDRGPPLIHIIYEPSHHNDGSFYRAVAQGVRGHHWRFGNMPRIEGVGEADVEKIIVYVRETQRANGIN